MAEEFQRATNGRVRLTVGISGTGGGFQKFCNNETDISNASRPISLAEMERCKAGNIDWMELPIAFDGLSVMTSPRNTFLDCLKKSELKKMWEPEAQGTITTLEPDPTRVAGPADQPVRPGHRLRHVRLLHRRDQWPREGQPRRLTPPARTTTSWCRASPTIPNALGYFGFAYYEENTRQLKLLGVDNETGAAASSPRPRRSPTAPTRRCRGRSSSTPRSASLDKPEVREFVRFYVNPANAELISQTGYIPFPQALLRAGHAAARQWSAGHRLHGIR